MNEDVLRERWDDQFHQSAEYRDVLKKASIAQSLRRQRGQFGGPVNAESDPMVRALGDAHNDEVRDYLDRAQQKAATRFFQPHGVGEGAMAPEEVNYADHYPWVKVRLGPSRDLGGVAQAAEEMSHFRGEDWTPEQRLLSIQAQRGPVYAPADVQAVEGAAHARGVERNARAAEVQQEASQQETERIRRRQKMQQYLEPDLLAVFDRLPGRERNDILMSPPERQLAVLSSHPTRGLPQSGLNARSNAGMADPNYMNRLFKPSGSLLPTSITPRGRGTTRPSAQLLNSFDSGGYGDGNDE